MQNLFNNTRFAVGIEPEFNGKTPGEMNRINNNQNSILYFNIMNLTLLMK